jgi:hypothetical protein
METKDETKQKGFQWMMIGTVGSIAACVTGMFLLFPLCCLPFTMIIGIMGALWYFKN